MPTPTQEESDLAKLGATPLHKKQNSGAGPVGRLPDAASASDSLAAAAKAAAVLSAATSGTEPVTKRPGRPPIGAAPMSGAERSKQAAATTKPSRTTGPS
jgi:hypothetical protein